MFDTTGSLGRRPSRLARVLCVVMALVTFASSIPAWGDPGDIFMISAPVIGAEAPKATPLADGDTSVSEQTGAFQYSYPITVPPGRHGMQPHLALHYSSQTPIYGGLAAGWSLSLPLITLDTSEGRLAATAFQPPRKTYTSSMAGGRPLVPVQETTSSDVSATYRAQNDASFVRYERMAAGSGFAWRAYALDGTISYFGDTDLAGACGTMISDEYAPLTRVSDAFGNLVEYRYTPGVAGECQIIQITWGQNVGDDSVGPFASVTFLYAPSPPTCAGIPVGSQTSYRTGTKIVTGAGQLDSITITAFVPPVGRRRSTRASSRSTYSAAEASCAATHAAYRSLTSIQESAWGDAEQPRVDLPAVTFTYGSASFGQGALAYPPETLTTVPWLPNPNNSATN